MLQLAGVIKSISYVDHFPVAFIDTSRVYRLRDMTAIIDLLIDDIVVVFVDLPLLVLRIIRKYSLLLANIVG